ncbi:MAG: glycosyltransferase family 2 protein [Pseudomonadota bacterium]
MTELRLRLRDPKEINQPEPHRLLGELLVGSGKIGPNDLRHALRLQGSIDAPLGDIMVSEGLVSKSDVLGALAKQAHAEGADLTLAPPSPEMARRLPSEPCLRHGVLPWREDARALLVATSSPADFTALRASLGPAEPRLMPVIVDEEQVMQYQSRLYGAELAEKAAHQVPARESCRGWDARGVWRVRSVLAFFGGLLAGLIWAPVLVMSVLVMIAAAMLLMTTLLKLAALIAHITRPSPRRSPHATIKSSRFRLPRVSVLVPLLKEREIAGQLIARLSRLTYPKSLLNIVLVLEEGDHLTRDTIARTTLPDWMSVIEVPAAGNLTTKPRALNYALNFCRGSIIGVWDAEDWPEADQIERVVTRFQNAPETTACLQGVLDYYNSRTNWLTRCFTIEYATWWRVYLPGIARMGLVVPLGGTTLFFRRSALEALGGWDAHNVTEDADLGVRLARHGYTTELLPTVTHEEATSRAWPWVRQRSRWLKGFLITYFVHLRAPRTLLRELGLWRFLGVNALFLATVAQFALAPVLWSFWMVFAGFGHPVTSLLDPGLVWALIGLFVFAELLTISAGLVATASRAHAHLIPYLPTMALYFTLGTVAAYKALWEIVRAPFYWDKTQHGVSHQTDYKP